MRGFLGFGVAGNFAKHLEQAGEASEFIATGRDSEDGAPKGMFPFYVPNCETFLGRYCIDNSKIILPKDTTLRVQAEPEAAFECLVSYEDGKIKSLTPKAFMAFNDTSVRNDKNAKKLSQKKNFSVASKGHGLKIPIDRFESGGICDDYSLTSFLLFDGAAHQYGDNSKLTSYTYFYQKLIDWIVHTLNTQKDFAILESLDSFIQKAGYPKDLLVCIGSTSYTPLAEERFLKEGDKVCVAVYNHNLYTNDDIKELVEKGNFCDMKGVSILYQDVVYEK